LLICIRVPTGGPTRTIKLTGSAAEVHARIALSQRVCFDAIYGFTSSPDGPSRR
jgi:hypothetical protein